MSILGIELFAPPGTQGNRRLRKDGIFNRNAVATIYGESRFNEMRNKLPAPLRAAFKKAVEDIDRYKVRDGFRLWAGWIEYDGRSGDMGAAPLREVTVDIEGYPGATMTVSKYRFLMRSMTPTGG